ncbi:SDR family oxidoreductase [Telmatocola sphagniphila]|uniref:SDR family oxidoreductase n=1 Tax=Telmatocola sphagniphila TaxID=1123043 RepID=A0A8E6BAM5_9BACT|nr:SDR family oxidoreductase [Telmatocola sphagniphila]QVL34499.1 SDR family oxidoreductase [Telmatocola sphagniphila]
MSQPSLKHAGKIAFITGASSGIGRAAALALAREGADVALNYWTMAKEAEDTAAEIWSLGRKALLFQVDISHQQNVEKMTADIVSQLGGIDIFISSAVYSDREPFTTANMEGFRKTIDISMWGSFYALRAVSNVMLKQGRGGSMVIVSSPHSHIPFPNCMAYNMAKSAQDAMARSAAIELLPHKIRVNILHPGWTDTPGERKFFSDEAIKKAGSQTPMGRLATPEEMAHGIMFLVDPYSGYMTGSTLTMDGGLALPWWSKRGKDGEF